MFYVYDLIDPRDGRTFYVGKGTGKRLHQHVKEAKRGVAGIKCDLIREILDTGLDVQVEVVKEFTDEDKAYAFEKKRIAQLGLENLTNIAAGGREMSVGEFKQRREIRGLARAMARAARVLVKYKDVGFRFGGKWHDVRREDAESILWKGVRQVFDVLGESEARAEFRKYNIAIENRA